LDRTRFNATKIRRMIIMDENWKDLVPNAVYDLLTKINAKNRLTVISQTDTKPTEH